MVRRLIRDISSVLIIAGLLVVVDAGVTVVWQEPVTAAIGLIRQSDVNRHYLSYASAPLSGADVHVLRSIEPQTERIGYLARRERKQVTSGDAIGRITIPRLGDSYTVVQGTDEADLQAGPGHYPSTAFPGMGQTVAVAGHRTTYLAPFRFLNKLHRGDEIMVTMPYGRFTYGVQSLRVVAPTDIAVIDDVGYERLVLSACTPLYSAAQRLIVFARLRSVQPRGPARPAGA